MKNKPLLGGQAVIEGVMMKSKNNVSITVRKKDGSLACKKEKLKDNKYSNLPFIRGIITLVHMLVIGIKALVWSANQSVPEEEEEELSSKEIAIMIIISLGIGVGLFVALPYILTEIIGVKEVQSPILFNMIDGIIKISFFVLYLILISFMPDVKRLFQYHGAEHKAVHCHENDEELSVENCEKYTTIHPRCGTSFIMIVFTISIFIFSVLPISIKYLYPSFISLNMWMQKLLLFPIRIATLPIIAGIGYEILKALSRYEKNLIVKLITFPGLALQNLTTREPDKSQLEVAIHSLNNVLEEEKKFRSGNSLPDDL